MARAPRLHRGGRGFEPLSAHQIQGVFIDTYPSPQLSEIKARLYLDLDGVIYPIRPLYEETNVDSEDVGQLHEHEWWRKSISRRLASLGVEIVMASSWGVSFMQQEMRMSPLQEIKPTRALAIGPLFEGDPSKEEAVAKDLVNDPVPFIWIDDHLNQEMIDTVKESIPSSVPGLYVKTYKMQGLTHDEITAIEKTFLKQL